MKGVCLFIFAAMVVPGLAMTDSDFDSFKAWMADDPTDQNPYINVTYDCLAFSYAFQQNATTAGHKDIFMANLQGSKYPEGHWINAALVDGEYIFIEPQADIELFLENTSIIILDDSVETPIYLKGKNEIAITGDFLIPVKA